jgi:hypothetical protein
MEGSLEEGRLEQDERLDCFAMQQAPHLISLVAVLMVDECLVGRIGEVEMDSSVILGERRIH